MSAIEKINTEMQKNPDDRYMEIIGTYIIDRCTNDIVEAKVGAEGKTLAGAMAAVTDAARKVKRGNVAVLTHDKVFGVVDSYFAIPTDVEAQQKALMLVSGAVGAATVAQPAPKMLSLNPLDFM